MIDVNKISNRVRSDIVDALTQSGRYTRETALIQMQQMTARELFELYMNWNGMINWADSVAAALDSIRASETK